MKIIKYNGQTLKTEKFPLLSKEQCDLIRQDFFLKPSFEDVKKELKNIHNGGTKNSKVTDYYVYDLMCKVVIYHCKWSIEEFMQSDELISYFMNKTNENKKIFLDHESDARKLKTVIRLGGKGIVGKPTNFPIEVVRRILNKYTEPNENYHDMSCGWGARLTSSLAEKRNYFGTDPNYLLTERLVQLNKDYKRVNPDFFNSVKVDIRTQGSETFVPEWENKMDISFSSPPYFALEDYKIGEHQSYKPGTPYQEWLDNYYEPTIQNIYRYLKQGKCLLINIKDYDTYSLEWDTKRIAQKCGFVYEGNEVLTQIERVNSNGVFNDNSEQIFIFRKQ